MSHEYESDEYETDEESGESEEESEEEDDLDPEHKNMNCSLLLDAIVTHYKSCFLARESKYIKTIIRRLNE